MSGLGAPARVAAAPVSWGVSELMALPAGMTPETILDHMVVAGYAATELGPAGFLGDGATTRARLEQRGLALVGAFVPLRLSRPEQAAEDRSALAAMLDLLDAATPVIAQAGRPARDRPFQPPHSGDRPFIVLADASVEPDRLALCGRIASHPETWLPPTRFRAMVDGLHRAGEAIRGRGYEAVVHPHAGSYIETDAEIRAVVEALDPALVGLCLDTGHVALGGSHPPGLVRDYAERIRHVHLKDLDAGVLARVIGQGGGLGELLVAGVFAELGTGSAEVGETVERLLSHGYDGWMVVEQDRSVTPADTPAELLAAQVRNRRFLAGYGL